MQPADSGDGRDAGGAARDGGAGGGAASSARAAPGVQAASRAETKPGPSWGRWDAVLCGTFAVALFAYLGASRAVSAAVEKNASFAGKILPAPTQFLIDIDGWAARIGGTGSPLGSILPFFLFAGALLVTRPDRRRALMAVALMMELLVIVVYVAVVVIVPRAP